MVKRTLSTLLLVLTIIFPFSLSLLSCKSRTASLSGRQSAVLHSDGAIGAMAIENIPDDVSKYPKIAAAQAFVCDADSEKMLFARGAGKVLYPASTTKLLSILCALEILDTDAEVTPGDELDLVNEHSSLAFVRRNHTLTVEMLIEGMLLPSGNDAAYALAAAAGKELAGEKASAREAVDTFVAYMNDYAERLGMCGSHFTSPDGFYDPDNYSTVEDMALLSLAASKNPIITKYACLESDNVTYASGHTNTWINTNRMLHEDDAYYDPSVTGLKTGTAAEDNTCFICTFTVGEKNYIAGVFSEIDKDIRFEDMKKIVDFYK